MAEQRCAKAPCKSCPYRRDVPSGVWAASEYEKLPDYDGEITDQLRNGATALFGCHQANGDLCAGWVGTHGPHNLLALRLHAGVVHRSVWDYESPVPLFSSGQEACDHGKALIDVPNEGAKRIVKRLMRKRGLS